jgi:hypothetical protein
MEQNGSRLYAFDQQEFIVRFNARPQADTPAFVSHKLRKPSLEELIEWEKAQSYETVEVSKRENQIVSDDETSTARLWDRIIVEVEGYNFKDGDLGWRLLTDEQRAKTPLSHKLTAVKGLYRSQATVEYDDAAGVSFDSQDWRIRQEIGSPDDPFIVIHTLREPTEAEAREFRKAASSTSFVRGARKQQLKVTTNLKAHVKLYDTLMQGVDGASGLPQMDAIFKRQVVSALMEALDAQLSD